MRGPNFGKRKLTSDDVYLIRELYKEHVRLQEAVWEHEAQLEVLREKLRHVTVAAISRKFDVSGQHIHRIVMNKARVCYEDGDEYVSCN